MPLLQAMSARTNHLLNRENIEGHPHEALNADTLVGLAENLGIAITEAESAYLDAWPATMKEALRATIVSAARSGQPVTVSWAPGYDYQITMWEAADTDISPGGLTILLQGRYPGHNPVQGM